MNVMPHGRPGRDEIDIGTDDCVACPPLWRWVLVALATLVLCSCRAAPKAPVDGAPVSESAPASQSPAPESGASAPSPALPRPAAPSTIAPVESLNADGTVVTQAVYDADQDATQVELAQYPSPAPPHAYSTSRPYRPVLPMPSRPNAPFAQIGPDQVTPYPAVGRRAPATIPPNATLPPSAWTGSPADGYTQPYGCPCGRPCAGCCPPTPWAPAGIRRPWPADEYICDGCDKAPRVRVNPNWDVYGLDLEDTVAHYDTLDGRTLVEPSNKVCLYAPRFASVRKVYGMKLHEGHERMAGVEQPVRVKLSAESQLAAAVNQPLMPERNVGAKTPVSLLREQPPILISRNLSPQEFADDYLPYEDLLYIRTGIYDSAEKARLADRIETALVWTDDQEVQVILDEKKAFVAEASKKPQMFVEYRTGEPKLRLCKIASHCDATPGEIVEFTLRFDNIGQQVLGNVTILDNLTPRLEYVPDSSQSSLETEFFVEENEVGSQVLRWEIVHPLKRGKGGVIRFKCLVR